VSAMQDTDAHDGYGLDSFSLKTAQYMRRDYEIIVIEIFSH
jgi:hypothetical protein